MIDLRRPFYYTPISFQIYFSVYDIIMLYLFHGEDTIRSLNKLNGLVQNLLKKKGTDSSLFEINEDNFDESYFKNLIYGSHLFGDKNLVILKRVLENKNLVDYFLQNLVPFAQSSNVFIFWEESLKQEILTLFQKEAQKIWQFNRPEDKLSKERELETQAKERNKVIFQMIDAFSEKKSRSSWFLFQKNLMAGADEEEIFWKIFWQLKNLIILKPYQKESVDLINRQIKLHPFVLKKCLSVLPLWTKEELEAISKKLLEIYQAHRYNKIELSVGIEKMLLNL